MGLRDEVEQVRVRRLPDLSLEGARFTELPAELFECSHLEWLDLSRSHLASLSPAIGRLKNLRVLRLANTHITELPEEIGELANLRSLDLSRTRLTRLPESIGQLHKLEHLNLEGVRLHGLPLGFGRLSELAKCDFDTQEFDSDTKAAVDGGLNELRSYLRRLEMEGIELNEAKLVLVGEGGVGKSSLLATLRGESWEPSRLRTHGIEIRELAIEGQHESDSLTIHCWDFGGQTIYRQTHQLFFTAPAVYLVVWKPREGADQNFVEYWIQSILRRAGDTANVGIIVVATHASDGCVARIDRSALRRTYGDAIKGFVHVDSCDGVDIEQLRQTISDVVGGLPKARRLFPSSWQRAHQLLDKLSQPYLPLHSILDLLVANGLDSESANAFLRHAHQNGRILHYADESSTADLVILRPDWVSQALSLVLEDPETIATHGLVAHARLAYLWDDPRKPDELRYPALVHSHLLRLMERFDLSYRVRDEVASGERESRFSLIAQLVPTDSPLLPEWEQRGAEELPVALQAVALRDRNSGIPVAPDGLICQLIVRFHRYSLGFEDAERAVHWQAGMLLDAGHNGRALVRLDPGLLTVTVRGYYPQFFLSKIVDDVMWLVGRLWPGLDATRQVSCRSSCTGTGDGWFHVDRLMAAKEQGRPEFPCPECTEWKGIDDLLVGHAYPRDDLDVELAELIRRQVGQFSDELLSRIDAVVDETLKGLDSQANHGPRLFVVVPAESNWRKPNWTVQRFRVILFCEHSRLPLYLLSGGSHGVYDVEVSREWVKRIAPAAKAVARVLAVALPVARSIVELAISDEEWARIEEQVALAASSIEALARVTSDGPASNHELMLPADSSLRRFHEWLKREDSSFGGLEKVRDGQRQVLWVHPRFVNEYRSSLPAMH